MMKMLNVVRATALAAVLMGASASAQEAPLKIVLVDVEGGTATLVVTPQGHSVLFDAGWPAGRGITAPPKDAPAPATPAPGNAERIIAQAIIGPQGGDATSIMGVNTAGTVRVNNLANLEALLNIIANGMEILGIAWGGPTMIMGFMHMAAGSHDAMKKVLFGAAGVTGGLATPGCINWLVASARDANLFS